MKRRRDTEVLSLSFLDCICCGFGAIILLLVLSKTGEPVALEISREELEGIVARLQEEVFELVGYTRDVTRELADEEERLADAETRVAGLERDVSRILGEFRSSEQDSVVMDIIEGRLSSAQQELTEEMQRLLGMSYRRRPTDATVGGIPVDSEYIIFIIDTSGSMRENWDMVTRKLTETLELYPKVKGIQVMNDMGEYMFSTYRGRWISDTAGRRRAIIKRMWSWSPFSNSSPVEGIHEAIRTYWSPDRKISIYVFGDEFTGVSIADAIYTVDALNGGAPSGERRVRIHGVGFPRPRRMLSVTFERYATLMRVLCERNGGTFVGLVRGT